MADSIKPSEAQSIPFCRIEGTVKDHIYPKPYMEGFSDPSEKTFLFKIKGDNAIKVKAYGCPGIQTEDRIGLGGYFTKDPEGRQYFLAIEIQEMASEERKAYGDAEYLAQEIPGIGKKTAKAIVEEMGPGVVRKLTEDPTIIDGCALIPDRAKAVIVTFFKGKDPEQVKIFTFLRGFCELSQLSSLRIWRRFKTTAEAVIRNDPFALLPEIEHLHFESVDRVRRKLGIPDDDTKRLAAALTYVLFKTLFQDGHVYLTRATLIEKTNDLLKGKDLGSKIIDTLEEEIEAGRLIREPIPGTRDAAIYLREEYESETYIAGDVNKMTSAPKQPSRPVKISSRYNLDSEQMEAIRMACIELLSIIHGPAGTGKTSLERPLIDTLAKYKSISAETEICLTAFTGKAAQRMREATGHHATTIHRLLKWDKSANSFTYNKDNKLPYKAYIVDECSMLTNHLFAKLLKAIPEGATIVIIGDHHQLPSIGGGSLLAELLRSGKVPHTELTIIHRTEGEDNPVLHTATRILANTMPEEMKNISIKYVPDDQTGKRLFLETVTAAERTRTLGLTQLRHYAMGVEEMNPILQERINPPTPGKKECRFSPTRVYREGDPVIHTRNDYELNVMNGQQGYVIDCDQAEKTITVAYPEGGGSKLVEYDSETSKFELELCYCTTAYKSQGIEAKDVIIFVPQGARVLNTRNSLYTMVTRAREKVTLIGMRSTIADCIANDAPEQRNTMLAYRINPEAGIRK